ncbi:2-oxo-4-hydroxy-4-carboxy-5-ureidoimidazoline decarboxylase [Halopseudomonas pachastrellae]|nr:2-oxo-4-hydroxy-4-carboxy-5-ureidoimidazoline decarboxylase [Halopseudomonas pachastrellae]
MKAKYASTEALASGEQAGARIASDAVLQRLKEGNDAYFDKFGFIFTFAPPARAPKKCLRCWSTPAQQPRAGNTYRC